MKLNSGVRIWFVGALSVLSALAFASAASAAVTPLDPSIHFDRTFTNIGEEQELAIPAGVREAQVEAIGGRGASKSGKAGGFAAKVTGPVDVGGLNLLYVLVGGNASNESGGFNGGGFGGSPSTGAAVGGGGGGASDVRTQSVFMGEASLLSRLLVAAGGGGAGALANSSSKANAAGGNAGHEGARAESLGADNTIGAGGFGGKSGTSSAGGAGGEGGFPYSAGTGDSGEDGHAGSLGAGGEGGPGPFSHPPGWGGGGGGGLYGGGGGGGGSDYTGGDTEENSGGGGGGGGSSLVPAGGTSVLDEDSGSTPQVTVEWTIPGTTMFGPDEYTSQAEPPLGLHSEEAGAEFECRVDSEEEAAWAPCGAEPAIGPLADGPHRVEARAVNAEGNFDPTPATLEFTVDTTAPVITSLIGPSVAEPTTDPQPTFTFSAEDLAPVHFDCGFDAPLGVCSGEGSATPPMPLATGEHTFTLTPIDAAGNVGLPVTRTFVVSPPPVQMSTTTAGSTAGPSPTPVGSTGNGSSGRVTPTIKLGKVKPNAKKGTATVLATVNGPGWLRLTGAKAKAATVKANGAGTVAIQVVAGRKALKQLKAKGTLTARITVTFTAAAGGTATASKTVRLHEKRPAHGHPHPHG